MQFVASVVVYGTASGAVKVEMLDQPSRVVDAGIACGTVHCTPVGWQDAIRVLYSRCSELLVS